MQTIQGNTQMKGVEVCGYMRERRLQNEGEGMGLD